MDGLKQGKTMQTQHYDFNTMNTKRKPNLLSIIVMSIVGGAILVSGFFMSMMLLAVSVILFPIVAIKIWFLRRKLQANLANNKASHQENDDIIEAEYVIVEETDVRKGSSQK